MTIMQRARNLFLNKEAEHQIKETYKELIEQLDEDPEISYHIHRNYINIWHNTGSIDIDLAMKEEEDDIHEVEFMLVDLKGDYIPDFKAVEYVIEKLKDTL